ncbi:MAG: cation transporter [Collinsella sp.]
MVCILANVALCAAKGAIGVLSGSVSIVADAMNNLSDASSNIVSVLGFKLASKAGGPRASLRTWPLRVSLGSGRGGARAADRR